MDKALRRSLGATTVELDARDGTATCLIPEPREIDLPGLEVAVHGAGYTLTRLEIEAKGTVVRARCEVCEAERYFFELPETGQRFEISGDHPPEGAAHLRGTLSGWGSGHPIFTLMGE